MSTKPLNLIGSGGQASVVLDALLAAGVPSQCIVIWTQDAEVACGTLLGSVTHHLAMLEHLSGQDFHVCIGDNTTRQKLHLGLIAAGARARSVLHPAAIVSPHSELGAGSFAAAGCIIAPRVKVGVGAIVNHGAVVDHDCQIGDFTHVAPGVTLGGGARLGDLVLIGAGANILPNRNIGANAIVGAGAVVISDVLEHDVVAGVPAASKR